MTNAEKILSGKTYLGIELGSTRIKACLTDDSFLPVAAGSYSWENRFENGFWTYSLEDIHNGIRACYADLVKNVKEKYGADLTEVGAIGVSAMMHGYMAFDKDNDLLVPFRTWRNTTTAQAADELTNLLGFNIPQRCSISHLYQAILNKEEHLSRLAYINTLAGYIHFLFTGRFEVGIGEASGIFPVESMQYNAEYVKKTEALFKEKGFSHKLADILPIPRNAGYKGAVLTEKGAAFLDPTGNLKSGIPVCPPEGDAGTGMTATNSIREKTGNVSAGTSVFSMLVLEKPLKGYYPEIDVVATPNGLPVAMVHCNNCCGEVDAWVKLFSEFAKLSGIDMDRSALYELLYKNAADSYIGDSGLAVYNFISGEPVAGVEEGHPMYFRKGNSKLTLGSFFRAQLYSSAAALKIGMDILFENESVLAECFTGHGGLFKIKGVAQQIFADAINTKFRTMETAGEGGAWGMSLLAAYMQKGNGRTLEDFLDEDVFSGMSSCTLSPSSEGRADFERFMENYKCGLAFQQKRKG